MQEKTIVPQEELADDLFESSTTDTISSLARDYGGGIAVHLVKDGHSLIQRDEAYDLARLIFKNEQAWGGVLNAEIPNLDESKLFDFLLAKQDEYSKKSNDPDNSMIYRNRGDFLGQLIAVIRASARR
jgi:hypothetical protein